MGDCSGRRARASAAVVLAGLASSLALFGASPPLAFAHASDPTVRTVLDEVEPALPGVTVQVVENVAAQLVVENPTADELAVLDDDGRPFLRIGPNGVEANLASPSFWLSNSPSGGASVPPDASMDAPPRWASVASEPAWGWYDHRLHPEARVVPAEVLEDDERATLAEWVVPLEYGGEPAAARGRLEFTPVRGQVVARLLPAADGAALPGVTAQLAPGRVPALFVANDSPEVVVVYGDDGEPFARLGPAGAAVNRHSPLWIDNARANDQDVSALVADPSAEPDWVEVSSSPGLTWLESRAASPEPPGAVMDEGREVVLSTWSVPLEQAGTRIELAGETTWQPVAESARGSGSGDDGVPAWLLALAVLVPVALVLAGLAARGRLRRGV